MKKDNVPQDKGSLLKHNLKDLCYVTDEEGRYTTVSSTGWEAKTIVQHESMELIRERVEETKKQIAMGELSPIAYYMELNKMNVSVLASYTNIWCWFVKRHLRAKHFSKLKERTLQKYAEAFDITIEQLKDIEKYREENK